MSDILTGTPPDLTYAHDLVRHAWMVVWAITSGALVVILGWMGLSFIMAEHLGTRQAGWREMVPRLVPGLVAFERNGLTRERREAYLGVVRRFPADKEEGAMAHRDYGPGEITALGESIYREQVQSRIGPVEKGTFVVIDIETGDYEIDPRDAAATRRLLERRPDAVTYGVGVGYRAAYRHIGGFQVPESRD